MYDVQRAAAVHHNIPDRKRHSRGGAHPLGRMSPTEVKSKWLLKIGGLVVRWVTTSEYPLLYVFVLYFAVFWKLDVGDDYYCNTPERI